MIHYSEGGKCSSLSVNCGVYLLSEKILRDTEFLKSVKGGQDDQQKTVTNEQKYNLSKL